ncbi:MAG: hypothetical protein ACFB20_13310 [Opitutales bacterium]
MNVTLKLADDLCKQARHRAVDEGVSLSRWVATLVERELGQSKVTALKALPKQTIGDRLHCPELAEYDFEIERIQGELREVDFD